MKAIARTILTLCMVAGSGLQVQAQLTNTLYFMHGVPQSNRINPAYQPVCSFYLGFPALSPLRLELSSNPLVWEDVIYPQDGELITFMHPDGDRDRFLRQLRGVNYVATDLGTTLGSLGFRTPIGFFSLEVATRWDGNIYYPGDLVRLMIKGVENDVTYELDGIGADLSLFNELSLGWSGQLMENLYFGVRAKVLFGMANLSTVSSDLSLYTSEERWTIQSDMQFNASLPFAEVTYGEEGELPDIELNSDLENLSSSTIPGYLLNGQNMGLGLDLGIDYRPIKQLRVSVSLTDLGYITWKDQVHEVSYRTNYDYMGLEVNPFEFSEDLSFGDYMDSTLNQMADSLQGFLEFGESGPYTKRLNTKLYAGASFELNKIISFGILSRTDILNRRVAEQVTASVGFRFGRYWNPTVTYSYMNSSFNNIGFGYSFNLGPFNSYFVTDNLITALLWPESTSSVNFWFGMNLMFGYKKLLKGPEADRPLVY